MTKKAVIYARQVPVFAATDVGVRARTAEEGVFLLSDHKLQIDGVRIKGEWKLSEGERVWLCPGYGLDGSFQLNAEKAAESLRSTELFWLEWRAPLEKTYPHRDYPPEEGRYVRGTDSSAVAVAVVLNTRPEEIPKELEALVEGGVKGDAALSGTVQTENIGIEKIVCNIVSNPNIRYLILGGPESEGHLTGDALKKFILRGVDDNRRIIDTRAPNPKLLNLPAEYIERFRKQISLIDLQFQGDPKLIEQAVRACQGKDTTIFGKYLLADPGPYPEAPLSGKIVWRVMQPWAEPEDDQERAAVKRAKELMERLGRKHRENSR